MKLNKEQKEAVSYKNGSLLIIAGAGTGKTTVITERIKYLISQGLAKPEEILALTFTEKSAREMEERVDIAMPYGYTQMWISTFHAFCDRILKSEAIHIGLNPGYKLMTQAESIQFLQRNIFKFNLKYFRPLGNPTKFVYGLLQHFSRLKDEDITPNQYIDWVKLKAPHFAHSTSLRASRGRQNKENIKEELEKWEELAGAYEKYEQMKIKESLFDFSDLISSTLKLFRRRKNILKQYQNQFKFILIDEFQDTNIAQYELIKLLCSNSKNPNLTVVGDDSQSIYKFRGAAISNILSFMKDFPSSKQVILTENYRSTQEILDRSYQLIKHNDPDTLEARLGISKNLISQKGKGGEKIGIIYENRVEDEAEKVTRLIEQENKKSLNHESNKANYQYKDFAILIRANNHAEPFIRALRRAGIPYQFLGPGMLFKQKEVKDLIAYLRLLNNFEDSVSFYRVLTMDLWEISARDIAAISAFAKRYNFSIFEACEEISKNFHDSNHESEKLNKEKYKLPFISNKTKYQVKNIINMVHRHLKLIPKETAGQILYYFLEDSGILKSLASVESVKEEQRVQNISKFFGKLKTYEAEYEDASVAAVVDWIELSLELGESSMASDDDWSENNAVNILTVHSSKGLEFPVVFLVNLTVGRFPTYERREQIPIPEDLIKETLPEGDYHQQEERRLFYVGATRAMDRLYFTASKYYGEGKRERKISPFVVEAVGGKVVSDQLSVVSNKKTEEQLSFLDFKKKEEEDKPIKNNQHLVTYLSYSQIETFNLCSLKYYYRYIVKIPTPASAAASFGQTIHEVLRSFYQEIKNGEKGSLEMLTTLLENKWIPLGYNSKAHENRMKKEAEKMLTDYFKNSFDEKILPISLEQNFTLPVAPRLRVGGKIDRVDEKNGKIEIIDYKTGKVATQKDIDKSLQMTVYALAATNRGMYGRRADEVILSFYFFQEQKKMSTKRTKEDLLQAEKDLVVKKTEIENSDFSPTPGRHCDFCEFKFICPVWEE